MDLIGTLGKLLVSGAMSKGGAGGLGSLLGAAAQQGGQTGGLGDLLGSLAGGKSGSAGGLGDLLGSLTGGQAGGAGGLGDLLGKLQQGGGAQSGDVGGMLGSLLGGGDNAGNAGGLGDLLGAALGQQLPKTQPAPKPNQAQSDQAGLLIRAMINAAKCDGSVDEEEQQKIVGKLGDIGKEEAVFIRAEMKAPLDTSNFINSIPRGMEQQVYLLSLMSINLDSKAEADYLDQLAKGLNISEQTSNQLHTELGAPQLYS